MTRTGHLDRIRARAEPGGEHGEAFTPAPSRGTVSKDGIDMTVTDIQPSYATLSCLVGREVRVVASVLDGGGIVPLTLEWLSTPVSFGGSTTYSVRLTGPTDAPLLPGRYRIRCGEITFVLSLTRFAREIRFVHYEACLSETAA
jgi:hypothetical protein